MLQCSWIRRHYNDSFHGWKLIPLKLIKKSFGDDLKFHSNLSFNNSCVKHFPSFYKNILLNWKQYLSTVSEIILGILSQNLLFNKHVIIDNCIVNFTKFSQKKYQFCRSIERSVSSWQWHVFSMGSVNISNAQDMERQN